MDRRIWSEVTPPRLEEYGSLALEQAIPVTLVLRDHAGKWAIASMRILAPCRDILPAGLTRRRD